MRRIASRLVAPSALALGLALALLASAAPVAAQDPADGTVVDTILGDGDVFYRGPVTHWAENAGDTTLHVIVVELKSPGK